MRNVVIAGYARSPFTLAKKGALAKVRPDEMAAQVISGLLKKTGIDPKEIEDIIVGCAFPEGEQGLNVARLISFIAHLPKEIAATTVNRFCGSSMQSIHMAAGAIHAKASAAQQAGKFKDEIVPIVDGNIRVEEDGCIRAGTSAETLAGLQLAFDQTGTVTAGTSSPLTDGASAVLVCSEDYAKAHGLKPLARIRSIAVAGCAPDLMGIGPVPATRKALDRAGLKLADIDIAELNEAFAAQALACLREADIPKEKINLDGGALALGHPLGATGARITGKAAALLKREGKEFALATQCIGGGQGIATVLQAV